MNADPKNRLMCSTSDANQDCTPDASWVASGLDGAIGTESSLFSWKNKNFFKNNRSTCTASGSTLFVQFTCIMPADMQEAKYNNMALAFGMSVLIAFLFTVSIRYMYQGGKIQMIEWDCSTVTAGDYSVEFPMDNKSTYQKWVEEVYEVAGGPMEQKEAPAYALKK